MPMHFSGHSNASVKTYDLINPRALSLHHHEIQLNSETIFWVESKQATISLHTQGREGPTVGACDTAATSPSLPWLIGDPSSTSARNMDIDARPVLQSEGHKAFGPPCTFHLQDRKYQWKRTHSKSLGSGLFASMNFKLVDATAGDDAPIAVYITTPLVGSSVDSVQHVARIDWFGSIGEELELASLVTVLGMVERLTNASKDAKFGMSGYANAGLIGNLGMGGMGPNSTGAF